ncbi:Hypothetical protein GbCGDNIH6_8177 [Granulibacter bethesdensis]|uniref:hypothetical protein n=1 Tax=Granulibacter bethesdensis TaxID=364410 RepID=UPI0009099983|nr:hypothetical protein [Granulibacter bethesdensis]APH55924.1 Hypothetical protein GbCGDNIH6_8177 [Granulibacter bethesdensis]
MTTNLNSGAMIGLLEEIGTYTASLEETKVFYIRNLTKNNIYFYDNNNYKNNWAWFYSNRNIQGKVLKTPQPVINPNTTTTTIIHFSQIALSLPENPLVVDTLKYISRLKFMTAGGICEMNFMIRGYRQIIFNGQSMVVQNSRGGSTFSTLYSGVKLRTIWGIKVCMLDFFEDDTEIPDINI